MRSAFLSIAALVAAALTAGSADAQLRRNRVVVSRPVESGTTFPRSAPTPIPGGTYPSTPYTTPYRPGTLSIGNGYNFYPGNLYSTYPGYRYWR
jgi:hypothetical protein